MPQDTDEILVAAKGNIYIAPVGTSLPATEVATLNGSFIDLGYTTEEGTSLTYGQTTEDIGAWQSPDPVRRIRTGTSMTVTFNLLQFNRLSFSLAFGGGTWSNASATSWRYDPPDSDDGLAEYAMVVDWQDGSKKTRLVVERGTVSEDVSTSLVRTNAAVLPISLKALKPDSSNSAWYSVTGDTEFGTTS